jgi:hypothetical protein
MKDWCNTESVLIRTHQIKDPNLEQIYCLFCGAEIKQVAGNDLYVDNEICKSCVDKKLQDKNIMREFIENDLDEFIKFIK